MANGFGTLFIGVSGLQSSQNALNTVANNLANVDTTGYVRQSVLFTDRDYVNVNTTTAIGYQQTGLGVYIGDVVHTRDVFLDRSYRTESSREAFYTASYMATYEVETLFQEMEGQAFQDSIEDFWTAFQEYAKAPDDEVNQNLVIQKAQLFLSRASAVYSGLQTYQQTINTQISDDIDRVNELGQTIHELNTQIMKIEAAGIETAMTLRDERDLALDELASLVSISYYENSNGVVRVSIEGAEFVDEARCYTMEKRVDKVTGFVTPYWASLSDTDKGIYVDVFNFNKDISTENNNDMGELKALLLARGDHVANYNDVLGMSQKNYDDSTGMSVMLRAEAQLDQLIHGIVTAINDALCPNVTAADLINEATGGTETTLQVQLSDGSTYTLTEKTKILDAENCAVGSDGELPPQELFVRIGTERYTTATYTVVKTDEDGNEVLDDDGNPVTETKTVYIYNEENYFDDTMQYTLQSISVNDALVSDESLLPYLMQNGDVDYALAEQLAALWDEECLTLSPNDTNPCTFADYYTAMIGELATYGDVYYSTATSLAATVDSIDNQRQQVIGVSSDEELTYMIKYQNAYNASSRFINVVDEMIEHLITQLG